MAISHLCEACEHVFFTPFLEDDVIEHFYKDYRGEKYNADRVAFEPDYKSLVYEFSDYRSGYFEARRNFYDEFHAGRFGVRGLVLDASDGGGYFGRYAYPHADVVAVPRVGATPGLNLPAALAAADVLMIAHTLQTIPRPLESLMRFVRDLRPGAEVWVEVPIQYRGGLNQAFTFGEAQFARGVREYGPLQTLHETMAHFSVRSLRTLLERAGLRPIEFVRSSIGVLGALAKRPTAAYSLVELDRPDGDLAITAHV